MIVEDIERLEKALERHGIKLTQKAIDDMEVVIDSIIETAEEKGFDKAIAENGLDEGR